MPHEPHNSAYLERLTGALEETVAEGRIGFPRFLRWLSRVEAGNPLGESLAFAIGFCERIFGSKPDREYRAGDDVLHINVQAVWPSGASAVISILREVAPVASKKSVSGNNGLEIMLLGSSGAAYFDGLAGGVPTVDEVAAE